MRKPVVFPPIKMDHFPLVGGLNLEASAFKISPSEVLAAQNYEQHVNGGYRRGWGYERHSGQAKPSDASYWTLPATVTGTLAQYDTITGFNSSATGVYLATDADDGLILTAVSGAFVSGEPLRVGGVTQATSTGPSAQVGASTMAKDATDFNLGADYYRSLISAVPGSGQIRGVVALSDIVYAFRDNAGATACAIYKSSASGWTAVSLFYEMSFTAASGSAPAEGATVTKGAVSAIVKRFVLQSGTLAGGTAAGRLIIAAPTGGSFSAGAFSSGITATCSGAEAAITLTAGGRYEFDLYNFGSGLRIYGCDGVNRGFEFDGTVFVPIVSGQTTDAPLHVACHKKHLFFSFGNSVQHSSIAFPYQWSAITGAAELNAGAPVTAMLPQGGDSTVGALGIWTRTNTQILYGNSSSDWVLNVVAPDAGAVPYTVINVGRAKYLDDRGITDLMATQEYGNFLSASLSRKIQSLIDDKRGLATAASVVRSQNQYRLYFSDATGLAVTFAGNKVLGIMPLNFSDVVRCAWSGTNSSGEETIYFGSDDGHIYQAEKGTSFDGDAITAYLRLAFYHAKSPNVEKSYQHATIEVSAEGYSEVSITPDFAFGDLSIPTHVASTEEVNGAGAYWGVETWGSFVWGAGQNSTVEVDIVGDGKNIGLTFYTSCDCYKPHTLQGVLLHYIPRTIVREG